MFGNSHGQPPAKFPRLVSGGPQGVTFSVVVSCLRKKAYVFRILLFCRNYRFATLRGSLALPEQTIHTLLPVLCSPTNSVGFVLVSTSIAQLCHHLRSILAVGLTLVICTLTDGVANAQTSAAVEQSFGFTARARFALAVWFAFAHPADAVDFGRANRSGCFGTRIGARRLLERFRLPQSQLLG